MHLLLETTYVKRTKKYYFNYHLEDKSPLHFVNTVKAIPFLFELLNFLFLNRDNIQKGMFDSLDRIIFDVLKSIALQKYSYYNIIMKKTDKFIRTNFDKYENVNFLTG